MSTNIEPFTLISPKKKKENEKLSTTKESMV